MKTSTPRETDFSKITKVADLIAYLDDTSKRLENRSHLYHYTKLNRVIDIYKGKKWHLGSAKCMNDRLEYANGDSARWENMFFACFMTDVKESIGMWSMYAQPWEDGVLITIPKKVVLNWVKSVRTIHEVSCTNFELTGRTLNVNKINRVVLSSVAYTNCDNPDSDERLTWSTTSNLKIAKASHIPELTGYIKDSAWDYEREIRIKAVLSSGHGFSRVAIDVPEEVLDSMTITAGPLFKGKLEERLQEEIRKRASVSQSLFYERLNINSPCEGCLARKKDV